ncbi:PREDICTED: thyroid hormone receptor beta-A-like [Rhagoletis zephyria]|uniref:thyroid hormone receptor beta-A-like n=1 Tax=Rhagoletis zephyria TaxID=28612 RepID=UPI00081195DB|nr:PREDICTED: thyroid hormone receptor beta-A-like [Rhagoletis zephyria]
MNTVDLKCEYFGNCHIDIKTRRNCQRCRMQKCFQIGMKLELINRRVVNHHPSSSSPSSSSTTSSDSSLVPLSSITITTASLIPNVDDPEKILDPYEEEFLHMFQSLCIIFRTFHPKVIGIASDVSQVFNMQEYLIKNIVNFSKCIESFKELNQHDQLLILKSSFTEIVMLRSLFYYEAREDSFPMRIDEAAENALLVPLDLLYKTKLHHLIELHRKLAEIVAQEKEDNLLRDLMAVLIMFKPRANVNNHEYINYEYSRYRYLLKRYLLVKYQDNYKANVYYLSLMQIITDVALLKQNFIEIFQMIDSKPVSHCLLEIYEITDNETTTTTK